MVYPRYEYAYDLYGNQTLIRDNVFMTDPTDPATIDRSGARETTFTYDFAGRQLARTLPMGQTEESVYALDGRLLRSSDFEGRVTTYQYDDQAGSGGRLLSRAFYESETAWNGGAGTPGETANYTYDAEGRVTSVTDSLSGTTTTAYDDEGRITEVASPQGTIHYDYDPVSGALVETSTGSLSSPTTRVAYAYDPIGELESVTMLRRDGADLASPEVTSYEYDALGMLETERLPGGIASHYVYDDMGRLDQLIQYAPDATPEDLSDNPVLASYDYESRADGKRVGVVETGAEGTTSIAWAYDGVGRLVRETYDSQYDDTLDYDTVYVFDLVGNRLRKETSTDVDPEPEEVISYVYDANDRLLEELKAVDGADVERTAYEWGWDGTENTATAMTRKVVTDLSTGQVTEATEYAYNLQGRLSRVRIDEYEGGSLSKVTEQEYTYDDSGIRTTKLERIDLDGDGTFDVVKATEYLNDKLDLTGYSQVLEEHTTVQEAGQPETQTSRTYTIGARIIAQYDDGNMTLVLLPDGHGSTRHVTDMAAQIVQTYHYDAYGNPHGFDAAQAPTTLLYNTEQYDAMTGLQYLRARYYSPTSGGFGSIDPYGGDTYKPCSFGRYAFAQGEPVMHLDPSGARIVIYEYWDTPTAFRNAVLNGLQELAGPSARLGLEAKREVSDRVSAGHALMTTYAVTIRSESSVLQYRTDPLWEALRRIIKDSFRVDIYRTEETDNAWGGMRFWTWRSGFVMINEKVETAPDVRIRTRFGPLITAQISPFSVTLWHEMGHAYHRLPDPKWYNWLGLWRVPSSVDFENIARISLRARGVQAKTFIQGTWELMPLQLRVGY